MTRNDDVRTAQSILLLLIGLMISLVGSFVATGMAMQGIDLFWIVSLSGYAVGLVGAARQLKYGKAYRDALITFVISALVVMSKQFTLTVYALYEIEISQMAWYMVTAAATVMNFHAISSAIQSQLNDAGASPELNKMGNRWSSWTLISLVIQLISLYGMGKFPIPEQWLLVVEMTLVVLAFAFMVSAVVMGVRFLLGARKFFLSRSGGKK